MILKNKILFIKTQIKNYIKLFRAADGPAEIENPGKIAENAVLERVVDASKPIFFFIFV